MPDNNVFFEEWIRSLREHYKYVVQANDQVTRASLEDVLHEVGFSEEDLKQILLEATMHVDQAPDGFVPDFDSLQEHLPHHHLHDHDEQAIESDEPDAKTISFSSNDSDPPAVEPEVPSETLSPEAQAVANEPVEPELEEDEQPGGDEETDIVPEEMDDPDEDDPQQLALF